ncbi:MAG: MFS transporter [Pseudomonadales bacterium]
MAEQGVPPASIWRLPSFRSYITASSATMFSFSMQQLLVSWLLIGALHEPADRVGLAQAIIGIPGLFIMLWGGASADRVDPRGLLVKVYGFAALIPLYLLAVDQLHVLSYWTVTSWALLMSVANSFQSPAQAALLNRSAAVRIQEAVTASTAVGLVMQVIGLGLAGQLERLGLASVLLVQAVAIIVGRVMISRLPAAPPRAPGGAVPAWRSVVEGFGVIGRDRLVLNVLVLNIISMLFNAGTFTLVFPFIMTRVYGGDAAFLALMLVVFWSGGSAINFLMLKFMPLRHPGKLFLSMQFTRALIFALFWIQPSLWLLIGATFLWGMNMGVTTTMSRTIIQESAGEQFRGRILSVYNVGFLGAQPVGALLLGVVVDQVGILNALIPGMLASVFLCVYGMLATPVWNYESPAQSS